MNKIKIGNSVAVTWRVNLTSAKGSNTLRKDKVRLYVKNTYEVKEISTFSIEDNVVSFIYDGKDQTYTGTYDLILKDEDEGTRYIEMENAFALVLHTPEERGQIASKDSSGNYIVELTEDALTIKDVDEDAAVYARLVAVEKKLAEGVLLTQEEKAVFDEITGIKDELISLPQEIVTDLEADADADKVSVSVSKFAKVDGSYTAQDMEVDIPSATETEAGVMSAADKARLEGCTESVYLFNLDELADDKGLIVKTGKPVTYAVNNGGRNVGVLTMYGDNMGHGITQILQTLVEIDADGKISGSHQDGTWHQYVRYYNIGSPYLTQEKGTWSKWKPYLDDDVEKVITAAVEKLTAVETALDGIGAIENGEIDNIWGN